MADFPTAVTTPRTISNRPGVVFDADDPKTFFAEDLNKANDEIVALETELGTTPKGAYATVKAWLTDLLPRTWRTKQNTTDASTPGIIVQTGWGFVVGDGTNTARLKAVTFPTAFPNSIIAVNISILGGINTATPTLITQFTQELYTTMANENAVIIAHSPAKTGFTARFWFSGPASAFSSSESVGFSWIAIGT